MKRLEAYNYEIHENDTVLKDTMLSEIEYFDKEGKFRRSISFWKGDTVGEVNWEIDSIRLVYTSGSSNRISPTKYTYDGYGNLISIISNANQIYYKNYYNDSILIKQISSEKTHYIKEYFYTDEGKLERIISYGNQADTILPSWVADTLISKWEYDNEDRVIRFFPSYSGGYVKFEYKNNGKEKHTLFLYKENREVYERVIEYENRDGTKIAEDYYRDGKLFSKKFYKIYYWDENDIQTPFQSNALSAGATIRSDGKLDITIREWSTLVENKYSIINGLLIVNRKHTTNKKENKSEIYNIDSDALYKKMKLVDLKNLKFPSPPSDVTDSDLEYDFEITIDGSSYSFSVYKVKCKELMQLVKQINHVLPDEMKIGYNKEYLKR